MPESVLSILELVWKHSLIRWPDTAADADEISGDINVCIAFSQQTHFSQEELLFSIRVGN